MILLLLECMRIFWHVINKRLNVVWGEQNVVYPISAYNLAQPKVKHDGSPPLSHLKFISLIRECGYDNVEC